VLTKLSHNRIGRIDLLPLDKADYPKTSLNLHAAHEARAFLGKIRSLQYRSSDGPLFLFAYALQPAVVLRKQDDCNGLKLLVMVEGRLTLQSGLPENLLLMEGKLCLFRSIDYLIDLPEATNVQYLLFDTEDLAERAGLENLAEGCYNLTTGMKTHLSEILQPPKLLAYPEKWLSMQLLNLLHKLSEEIELATQRIKGNTSNLSFALAADAFIQRNLDRNFTTKEIAKHVGLNECDLKNAFRDQFGMGMARWQNQLRIERAKQLLQQSDKSILDIAMECGYGAPNTLRYNFLIETDQTPANWRKTNKL
jgi:AraC-like DNA-binding protein